jgi:hypothetical protein
MLATRRHKIMKLYQCQALDAASGIKLSVIRYSVRAICIALSHRLVRRDLLDLRRELHGSEPSSIRRKTGARLRPSISQFPRHRVDDTPQTDNALRRDGAASGSIGRARAVGLPEARSDGFLQLDIDSLLNPAGSQTHEVGFGVAGRNLVADLESPSPQTGLDLRKGEFNAPAVHDFDLGCRGESWASCSTNSFNSTGRSDASGVSARRVLKGARFSGLMNFATAALPHGAKTIF